MGTTGPIDLPASSRLAARAAEADTAPAPTPVSVYVHVPFCLSKCAYCDFYSLAGQPEHHSRFVDAALFEIGHWSHYDLLDNVPTLYFGGGTPTALGDELVRLVSQTLSTVVLRDDAEVTVETNPESTSEELIASLITHGATRFSLGVQSFDDAVLATLGRRHSAARAREAAGVLAATGLPFSLDLICGVPGQSSSSWEATLKAAIATGARHVSVYPLGVEPGTPLAGAIAAGRVDDPDPDAAADMMLAAEVALAAAGLRRYEVANYAQPGHEARHNRVYWTGGAYIGIGPHAASMLPYPIFESAADKEGWTCPCGPVPPARVRFTRDSGLEGYLRRPLAEPGPFECLNADDAAREDLMLGMRLREGVRASDVSAAGEDAVFEQLAAEGLVRHNVDVDDGPRWATTEKGWLLGNRVFGAIWGAG